MVMFLLSWREWLDYLDYSSAMQSRASEFTSPSPWFFNLVRWIPPTPSVVRTRRWRRGQRVGRRPKQGQGARTQATDPNVPSHLLRRTRSRRERGLSPARAVRWRITPLPLHTHTPGAAPKPRQDWTLLEGRAAHWRHAIPGLCCALTSPHWRFRSKSRKLVCETDWRVPGSGAWVESVLSACRNWWLWPPKRDRSDQGDILSDGCSKIACSRS